MTMIPLCSRCSVSLPVHTAASSFCADCMEGREEVMTLHNLDHEKLIELAARCEAAAGPDRGIDGELDRLLNKRPKDGDYLEAERAIWRVDGHSGLATRHDGCARASFCAREFTASIDAAMTLKPSGLGLWLQWSMFDRERPIAEVVLTRTATTILNDSGAAYHCAETELVRARAATPALALCAAALRALAHKEETGRG